MEDNIKQLIITKPNSELKKHVYYSNFVELEDNLPDETIEEGKEILAKSVIDDLKKVGEIPIAILFSQKHCLHIDVWTEKLK